MSIKRTAKIEMPKLKRCKLEEPDDVGHGGCSGIEKKRKVNGFYSLGDAGDFSSGSASWNSEVSHSACDGGGEIEFNSSSVSRPPLLRSSRGRLQTLPSRFNDSVVL